MQLSAQTFRWDAVDGVLFDLDGVITPTTEIHEYAWAEVFADFAYTHEDYLVYIDGKSRYDGISSFLASRGMELPWGSLNDSPGWRTVCALGNLKNAVFNEVLGRDGISVYPGSQRTLDLLAQTAVPTAIVSSSKNARAVLDAAGLEDRFKVVIDGHSVAEGRLSGKPAPDTYLLAAELLGVDRTYTVVVEDATSGVAAGVAGEFGVVIGVDRGAGRNALLRNGATFVVSDLGDLLNQHRP